MMKKQFNRHVIIIEAVSEILLGSLLLTAADGVR